MARAKKPAKLEDSPVAKTKKNRKFRKFHDGLTVRGMFRLQIENEDGTIAGDSGWIENQITNVGFSLFLVDLIGNSSDSQQVLFVALGTGTAPAATDTQLANEISGSSRRTAPTFSNLSSKSAQFVGTFNSTSTFLSAASTLNNIGLFGKSSGNSVFAGQTYATSSCATNQNVNFTYQVSFS